MAQRRIIELQDDLDQSPATQTIRFSVNSVQYEIDLNDEHADEFYANLNGYMEAARRVGGRRSSGGRTASKSGGPSPQEIRDWAASQGIDVSARGRISTELREKYDAAH